MSEITLIGCSGKGISTEKRNGKRKRESLDYVLWYPVHPFATLPYFVLLCLLTSAVCIFFISEFY